MKFKKGDLVEAIWRSELYRGTVTRLVEATDEIEVKLAKKPAIDYLFKQNRVSKVELVKVPKFVADWIKYCKKHYWGLFEALDDTYESSCMPEEVTEWMENCHENQEIFARAWLDGYEVEQEPLYYVRFFDGGLGFLNVYYTGARLLNCHLGSEGYKTKFTESEIKNMDARYWDFAVPVEEVEAENNE
ncbi:DUF1642 domain-containing protein [Listeria monocytogenes]|uniref:DUF1642 domain-containing protein n=1 Tax=Listeria seeligeri TaxID=1640 RepID=UPI0017BF75A8|nr:DUF1642 domain-containing protein [Listeria seeligeri]EAG9676200.1 DUF1642 domain-containing protein [Listeria monocytogenes]EAG9721621.1 DUF1642 domain-containing protein [Listeria monocytogenes]EAG9737068.1 DUF1642 domain-containing protein [Listeria monocytogenes]EAG9758408.1 DUF1642 domain-containing protein [Listeria monocytogenes]EAG9787595.1 DUF1642 domain-containing protein [Listeria monocytogenes]